MEPLEEIRRRLECQVNEFFAPYTTNDRKQQIEALLENFSKQPGSWKQALYFLSRPQSFSNEYLVMYCLSVIENSVKGRWLIMSHQEQSELQSTLFAFLIQHSAASSHLKCPNFIRNKVIKILTDVGKFSWPQSIPEFFSNVMQVAGNEDTVVIGLLFLKTISEEWSNCKDEVSTDRKIELKYLIVKEVRRIFELLQEILVAGLKHYTSSESPTEGQQQQSRGAQPMNPALHEILAQALETCAHFCTWIPFDGITLSGVAQCSQNSQNKTVPFSVDFLRILCQYALVDTTGYMEGNEGPENLSILALNVLNELLYRKYVPKEFDEQITLVTTFAIDLLTKLGSGTSLSIVHNKYLDKGIEFLCLIANSYFFRYNQQTSKAYTSLLLPFTFAQTQTVFYYECLEIWKLILDHLIADVPFTNLTNNRENLLDNFKSVFLDLALGIVQSATKFDLTENDEYYDDEDDEDVEVLSLSKNIDVLVKIGELLPSESLERVTSTWTTSCQYFANLQTKLDQSKTVLQIDSPTDVKHFSFVVQLIGRIAEIFYGDVFKNELELGKNLVHQLIELMIVSKNFYFVQTPAVIIQANCEVVYSLRTWTYWLGRYYSEIVLADCSPSEAQNFYELLTVAAEVLCFTLDNRAVIHPSLMLANANFFATLVNSIRSKHIFKLPWVQTLIEKIHTLRDSVQTDTFRVLNKSVASLLILPWQSTSEQDWELRTGLYNEFMKNTMGEMVASTRDPSKLVLCIRVLNDQLDILQTECGNSKKICWGVFKEIVQFMHKLLPLYLKRPEVSEEILNFFLKIMEVLRQQAGAPFFEETVRIFLNLFASANIINDLMKETELSSAIVLEKFLQMLQFMVKDPSPSFKKFLPDCLSVALDHIYPVLAQRTSPDVKLPFFLFIRDTVNFRWNYFFPGFLYTAPSVSGSPPPPPVSDDEREVSRRLYQIFESIGHSFLQSDLEVFRFNLNTLSIWNQKHQIYNRMSIDPKMSDGFMGVLIQVLASKSHDLLREEIAFNLYEMSLVDFPRYWQVFLPQTLQKDFPQLSSDQRVALAGKFKPKTTSNISSGNGFSSRSGENIDLSGFSMTLYKFIEDLRYYHFCTECLNSNKPRQVDASP